MTRKIQIITGEINTGKTTFAESFVRKRREEGAVVAGVLTYGIRQEGIKKGFAVCDIRTGERKLLAAAPDFTFTSSAEQFFDANGPAARRPTLPTTGRFIFDPEAFAFADTAIKRADPSGASAGATVGVPADLVVIDELGRLEVEGGGLFSSARWAYEQFSGDLLFVIRERLVSIILRKLSIPESSVDIINPSHNRDFPAKS